MEEVPSWLGSGAKIPGGERGGARAGRLEWEVDAYGDIRTSYGR